MLGPVQLRDGDREVDVGPPQQRAVLAALLVDAGRLVTVETLLARVWDDEPPAGARRTLHTYIARIRRLLEQAGDGPRLEHRTNGYLLDVDPDRVDLHVFRGLVDRARDASCDAGQRLAWLRTALGLWRGEPVAGLAGRWAAGVREGWRRRYLDAVLAWAQAEISTGNPGAVIGPVTDLITEYPLTEPLVAALMRALYAAGHPGEALDCYRDARARLVDQLGSEPGAELRSLQQAVLRGTPLASARPLPPALPAADTGTDTGGLGRPAIGPAAPSGGDPTGVPAQLPADVYGFAGRAAELARLDGLLASGAAEPTAVVVGAVCGTAGVGKTALAIRWAHRVRARFPDGQLYVNLRGFDPGGQVMAPGEAVRGFLDALGVSPQRVPSGLDAQRALYRTLLAGKRMLLVLDNARDAEQVRPLLPGSPTVLVVVTSRNQLTGLVAEGAHPVTLGMLTLDEARDLLARRLGVDRVAAGPAAVEEIISRSARLPLALVLVAARAATHPDFPLAALAAELRDTHGGLDMFAGTDAATNVRTVFSWSYQTLGPETARLFRLVGLHPGPDISAAAAASLAGVPVRRVRRLLAELTQAHLLTEHAPARYTFHDLLRGYAADLAYTIDPGDQRLAGVYRVLDHYLHTAHTAARLLAPHRDPITVAPAQPHVTPEDPGDYDGAVAWLAAEHPVLMALVALAARTGFDHHVWPMAWAMEIFLIRQGQGHWPDRIALWQAALAAAGRLDDLPAQAGAHRYLGLAYTDRYLHEPARAHFQSALDLVERLGDRVGQGHTHMAYGRLWQAQGRHAEALRHDRQALELYRLAEHRYGQADALNVIGWDCAQLGQHEQALIYCGEALRLLQELGDRYGQAVTWDSLGFAYRHLGQYEQAIACYQTALELNEGIGADYIDALTLDHLGDALEAAGDADAARSAHQRLAAVVERLDLPDADPLRIKLTRLDDAGPQPDDLPTASAGA
ncbi:MAG: hypothetical protein V7637_6703 [Mycobacteriales bacterium]